MRPDRLSVGRLTVPLIAFVACLAAAPAGGVEPTDAFRGAPPATRKAPVVDRYHGVEVEDDYRWLENGGDAEVQAWSDAQNAYARSILDRLPGVDAIRREVTAIRKIEVPAYLRLASAGGKLFALKQEPPKQQAVLVVMASEDDPASARVVVDPNTIDSRGGTTVDWYVPSPDGALVAVSLSENGTERGNLHVYATASGKETGDAIHSVYRGTAGGSLAWDGDGRGFYYTRYPRPGERPAADLDFYARVYHHRLGTPEAADRYEIGKDFLRIAEVWLHRSPDGRTLLASVEKGDSSEYEHYLRTPRGRWLRLTRFSDQIVLAELGPHGSLYLLSRAGAPRGKLLKVRLADVLRSGRLDLAQATLVVPESDGATEIDPWAAVGTVTVTATRLLILEGIGGPHRVRIFDLNGRPLGELPLPPASAVNQLVRAGGRNPDAVLIQTQSYTAPPAWLRWAPDAGSPVKTALSVPFPIDFGDVEVVRDAAPSKDGTRVPMTILFRKGTRLDGSNPVRLTGYGGFGLSQVPRFNPGLRIWLDHGGVVAFANLRGGGELGDEWHQAGSLTRKQNVFDDFIGCAEQLIRAGYTSQNRLAIEGGSNGGLLMGAALTQRPDLFKAVVSRVGIYDMLRVELDPNGEFNVPEFGSVNDPVQFRALYTYSPYHHVRDGVAYPPALFLTGAHDARVNPMQSRKMTARLQAAGARGVLLRTSATSGHGAGMRLDERIEQEVDVLAFLFAQLGMNAASGSRTP